jgi:hypothetical protein
MSCQTESKIFEAFTVDWHLFKARIQDLGCLKYTTSFQDVAPTISSLAPDFSLDVDTTIT